MKNKLWLIVLCAFCGILTAPRVALAGGPGASIEREGHGGDPFQLDFLHRAQFVLDELTYRHIVSNDLTARFRVAVSGLRVEMSKDLPAVGWVVNDDNRPGMRKVLLDRAKYLYSFDRATRIDLNLFVAHEVWETVGIDENKEVTTGLRFNESDYIRWYGDRFPGEPTPRQSLHGAASASNGIASGAGTEGDVVIVTGNNSIVAPPGDTVVASNGSNVVTRDGNGVVVTRNGAAVAPSGDTIISEGGRTIIAPAGTSISVLEDRAAGGGGIQ